MPLIASLLQKLAWKRKTMRARILDLDGSMPSQTGLLARCHPIIRPLANWGPPIRIACSFAKFRRFEQALGRLLGGDTDSEPTLTFSGSGDFHHVSLALVRRLRKPVNLLVIDNHPDWMKGVPFLHCGTWLYHAARLPWVKRIFHVGGDVDFDNGFRWMAPWRLLRDQKIIVFGARRRFKGRPWDTVVNKPLREAGELTMSGHQMEQLLGPYAEELSQFPLYISLDKDVLPVSEAAVNWDSGHLTLEETGKVLKAFGQAARGKLAGVDIVGDWSPVQVQGLLPWTFHLTEHPALSVDPLEASNRNERANLFLLACLNETEIPNRQVAWELSFSFGGLNTSESRPPARR
jgi:hypothetical protein